MAAWIAALASAFVCTPAALAANRFAVDAGGSGTSDCSQQTLGDVLHEACSLDHAVNGALLGDHVVLVSSAYETSALSLPAGVTLEGAAGQPRPVVGGATVTPLVSADLAGSTIKHVTIQQDHATAAALQVLSTGGLDDVAAVTTASDGTAAVLGPLVPATRSTFSARGGGASIGIRAVGPSGGPILHNVTAYGSGSNGAGLDAGVNAATVTATNSIFRDPAGDTDVTNSGGGTVTLAFTNVNYGSANGGAGSFLGGLGQQASTPLLADPTGGNFHELAGSPTIDAGIPDPVAGLTDPDGDPRVLGAAQDIGADEYVPHAPAATTGLPVGVTTSGATLTGSVDPNGLPTSFHFDYGPTPTYGQSTPAGSAGSASGAQQVSTALGNLAPGSIVHYRLVAANADGSSAGLDQILIVLSNPPGPLPVPSSGPTLTGIKFTQAPPVGHPTVLTVTGSDPQQAVTGIVIDFGENGRLFAESACRLRPGAGKGVFAAGGSNTFKVPYAFMSPGLHLVQVTLTSGCGTGQRATTQVIQVSPQAAAAGKRGKAAAKSLSGAKKKKKKHKKKRKPAGCGNVNALPTAANAKQIAASTVCLLNKQRAAYHLGALRVNNQLVKAGVYHANAMLGGHFFAHQGPGEPPLGARFQAVKYTGGGGENLGVSVGVPYETPASMVAAWMASPTHRANILFASFHTVGQVVVPAKPEVPGVPGATYVTEFGTTKK